MAACLDQPSTGFRYPDDDLLLEETNHRCSNDLQMVVSLLALQSSRAKSDETRQALTDAMERVSVLARSRAAFQHQKHLTLEAALRQVCEALYAQAEPRSILISCQVAHESYGLSPTQIMTFALTVNELATNAIKHAFKQCKSGRIRILAREDDGRNLTIVLGTALADAGQAAQIVGFRFRQVGGRQQGRWFSIAEAAAGDPLVMVPGLHDHND